MGLFGPKFMLDEGTTNWIFDTFAWALEHFGTDLFYQHSPLVLPNNEFFPDSVSQGDNVARSIFERVRDYAGMGEWPCKLVALEEDIDPVVGPALMIQGAPIGPAGNFSVSPGKTPTIEIAYAPSQVSRPEALVATFAHELAHYLMHSVPTNPPGGEDLEEFATDLVAVFMGFGVFMANSAFEFRQFTDVDTQGWQAHAQGYLSEKELTYCLAIFTVLKGIDRKSFEGYLDKSVRKRLKRAIKEMGYLEEDVARLRAIESFKIAQPKM